MLSSPALSRIPFQTLQKEKRNLDAKRKSVEVTGFETKSKSSDDHELKRKRQENTERNKRIVEKHMQTQFVKSFTSEKSLLLQSEKRQARAAADRCVGMKRLPPKKVQNSGTRAAEKLRQSEQRVVQKLEGSTTFMGAQDKLAQIFSEVQKVKGYISGLHLMGCTISKSGMFAVVTWLQHISPSIDRDREAKSPTVTSIVQANVTSFDTIGRTIDDIPDTAFKEHWVLPCQVINVPDGDTIRVRHTPTAHVGDSIRFQEEPEQHRGSWRRHLKEETLLLRLCAIDAPETAKGDLEGQPFADRATDYLRDRCSETVVLVKLLGRDQYGRGLAVVIVEDRETTCGCIPSRVKRDVGEELIQEGLATVYTGRGAEYDGRRQKYETLLEGAKKNNKGLWALPSNIRVLPAEYKRSHKKSLQRRELLMKVGEKTPKCEGATVDGCESNNEDVRDSVEGEIVADEGEYNDKGVFIEVESNEFDSGIHQAGVEDGYNADSVNREFIAQREGVSDERTGGSGIDLGQQSRKHRSRQNKHYRRCRRKRRRDGKGRVNGETRVEATTTPYREGCDEDVPRDVLVDRGWHYRVADDNEGELVDYGNLGHKQSNMNGERKRKRKRKRKKKKKKKE